MRETVYRVPERSLVLLVAVVRDGGRSSVSAIAREAGMPIATAHRHIAALVKAGFLRPAGFARHLPGAELRALMPMLDDRQVLANAARPMLERLAAKTGNVVQLGTFDADMVTYLVKAGESADALFTKVGMQLEAYCSGIGKVLLAHLSGADRARYLAGGPFIALTERTITDPAHLQIELEQVAWQGFAIDDGEVVPGLQCLAVPVRTASGQVIAAISTSRAARGELDSWRQRIFPRLREVADEIGRKANP